MSAVDITEHFSHCRWDIVLMFLFMFHVDVNSTLYIDNNYTHILGAVLVLQAAAFQSIVSENVTMA